MTLMDGKPLYTITAYTAEQQAMLALFGGTQAVIGHEMSGIHHCYGPLPDSPDDRAEHAHLRRYRCPLVFFKDRLRLIDHDGDVIALDTVD